MSGWTPADSRKCQVSVRLFDRQIRIKGSEGTWGLLQVGGAGIAREEQGGHSRWGEGIPEMGRYCLDSNRRWIWKHKKDYGEKGPESGA